jgi:1,4-alpha-glucan branching enzyme
MIRKQRAAGGTATKLTFVLPDSGQGVSVVADFNAWDPLRHPLKKRTNGTRSVQVSLPAGTTVRFRYLADTGQFFDDPEADGYEPNGCGETHSLVSA